MKVVIETPKYSFVKYMRAGRKYVKALTSPLPTLFNYGFVEGARGGDGMPKDCIVLGPRLRQGTEMELKPLGEVYFTDDRREDNKTVFSASGTVNKLDETRILLFFTAYAAYKRLHYLLKEHRIADCKYGGFKLTLTSRPPL